MANGLDINLRSDLHEAPPDARSPLQRRWDDVVELIRSWGPAILIVFTIRSVLVEPFQIPSGSMVPTLAIGDFIVVSKFTYGLRVPFTDIEILPLGEPERGDIIVFTHPPPNQDHDPWCWAKRLPRALSFDSLPGPERCSEDYIKRLVGLPGDTIELRDHVLYINGVEQARTRNGSYDYVNEGCSGEDMWSYEEDLSGVEHTVLQAASRFGSMSDYGPITVPPGNYFMMGDNRDNSSDSRFWGFVPRSYIRGKAKYVWASFDGCNGNIPGLGSVRFNRIGTALR